MKPPRVLSAVVLAVLLPPPAFTAALVSRLPSSSPLPVSAPVSAPISAPAFATPPVEPAATGLPPALASSPQAIAAAALAPTPAPDIAAAPATVVGDARRPESAAPRAPTSVAALMERMSRALIGERREHPDVGDLVLVGQTGQSLSLMINKNEVRVPLPTLGRLQSYGDDAPNVNVPIRYGRTAMLLGLPLAYSMLSTVHPQNLRAAAREIRLEVAAATAFAPGETVRVRDEATGEIRRAAFVGLRRDEGGKYELRDPDGATRVSSTRLVYKDAVGPLPPQTPAMPADESKLLWPEMRTHRGDALEDFLDGAAWLSSHPEFRAAPHPERWRMLGAYLRALMRPAEEAALGEMLGLGFPELLTYGLGMCRHFSSLIVAALRESGYEARVMMRVLPGDLGSGHAWVEVESPSRREEDRWMIDLMNDHVISWVEAQAMARQSEKSMAAIFYASPERREHAPTAAAK